MTTVLDAPRPVGVLHDGRWLTGWLEAWRRDSGHWRACVRYTAGVGMAYLQWRDGGTGPTCGARAVVT